MQDRETADSIDEAASLWAARLDRGLNDAERSALEDWLSGDSRRVGALARARALWCHAESNLREISPLAAPPAMPVPERTPRLSRRALLGGGAALAASAAAVMLVPRWLAASAMLESGVGEVRRVALEDGSAITLGPQSLARLRFDAVHRGVELLAGDAFFEIVEDSQRPFLVVARWLTLRALDTAFGVRAVEGLPLSVVVARGRIEVRDMHSRQNRSLSANMRLDSRHQDDMATSSLEPDALQRTLAWRSGLLSFEGETLAAVAAQFDRYGPVRIEIGDADLGREPVTGLFAANDPRGFARAIAASLDATVENDGDVVRLNRKS
jgi:transmembrane sensor